MKEIYAKDERKEHTFLEEPAYFGDCLPDDAHKPISDARSRWRLPTMGAAGTTGTRQAFHNTHRKPGNGLRLRLAGEVEVLRSQALPYSSRLTLLRQNIGKKPGRSKNPGPQQGSFTRKNDLAADTLGWPIKYAKQSQNVYGGLRQGDTFLLKVPLKNALKEILFKLFKHLLR